MRILDRFLCASGTCLYILIYTKQFTSAAYYGMLLSNSWAFDPDIYLYSSGDLMPVCCQSSQWQQISTYVRRGNFNYEKYQTSEDNYNINNYGCYSIWNYAIYGNNLPYKIYNRNILCWLRYDTGVDCFTSF